MRQRLGRDDFEQASQIRESGSGTRIWKVCETYELRAPANSPDGEILDRVLVPSHPNEPANFEVWRSYEPLRDTPDLFLKFARIYAADNVGNAIVEWVHSYGSLGHGERPYQAGSPQQLQQFWEEVECAAGIVAMYEAVLNGQEEQARSACLQFPFVSVFGMLFKEVANGPLNTLRNVAVEHVDETIKETYEGDYLRYALATAAYRVEYMVRNYCLPSLWVAEGSRDPNEVSATWNFQSLLGAMYLQMYWLMASGSEITRCEYCGLLLSLARPNPEGRKRRNDKRFCGDACRQAHHRSKKKGKDTE